MSMNKAPDGLCRPPGVPVFLLDDAANNHTVVRKGLTTSDDETKIDQNKTKM